MSDIAVSFSALDAEKRALQNRMDALQREMNSDKSSDAGLFSSLENEYTQVHQAHSSLRNAGYIAHVKVSIVQAPMQPRRRRVRSWFLPSSQSITTRDGQHRGLQPQHGLHASPHHHHDSHHHHHDSHHHHQSHDRDAGSFLLHQSQEHPAAAPFTSHNHSTAHAPHLQGPTTDQLLGARLSSLSSTRVCAVLTSVGDLCFFEETTTESPTHRLDEHQRTRTHIPASASARAHAGSPMATRPHAATPRSPTIYDALVTSPSPARSSHLSEGDSFPPHSPLSSSASSSTSTSSTHIVTHLSSLDLRSHTPPLRSRAFTPTLMASSADKSQPQQKLLAVYSLENLSQMRVAHEAVADISSADTDATSGSGSGSGTNRDRNIPHRSALPAMVLDFTDDAGLSRLVLWPDVEPAHHHQRPQSPLLNLFTRSGSGQDRASDTGGDGSKQSNDSAHEKAAHNMDLISGFLELVACVGEVLDRMKRQTRRVFRLVTEHTHILAREPREEDAIVRRMLRDIERACNVPVVGTQNVAVEELATELGTCGVLPLVLWRGWTRDDPTYCATVLDYAASSSRVTLVTLATVATSLIVNLLSLPKAALDEEIDMAATRSSPCLAFLCRLETHSDPLVLLFVRTMKLLMELMEAVECAGPEHLPHVMQKVKQRLARALEYQPRSLLELELLLEG